jgi:septal ring factor EnvC (AmiA/AmiB activator)
MEINTFEQMKYLKIVFFFICVLFAVNAHAQSSAELKRQRDQLNSQLEQLNHELQETMNNKKSTLTQLNIIKRQISIRTEKIGNINTAVRNLDNQISESNHTVHRLQSQLDQLKKDYAGMVLFAYRNQSAYNKLMFIFASKDFNQAYKRLKYLQQFGTYRERQAKYIQGTQKDLGIKIVKLDKDKEEKHSLLVDQEKEKATLGKQKVSQLKVVADLTRHGGALRQQQLDVQQRLVRMNREIAAAIKRDIEEARRKAAEEERLAAKNDASRAKTTNRDAPAVRSSAKRTNSEVLNATPEAARLSSDFLSNKGRLPWPVINGKISHGFGTYSYQGITMDNTGLDIKTNDGATVRAVFEGEVTKATDIGGAFLVIVKHGEYYTSYSNLRTVSVSKGQKVSTKQSIGTVATDAGTGESEVQFGLYKGITAVNPQVWLADR